MAEVWFEARKVEAWLSGSPVIRQLNLTLELGQSTTVPVPTPRTLKPSV